MKKTIFILAAAIFLAASASAQIFQYGIKAGVNFATLSMDDITGISDGTQVYDLITGESVRGYQVGVMTRVKIAMIFVQPELYFNTSGGTLDKVVNGETEILNVKFNRIDIPLLVGAKFGPARINVGPVGSFVFKSKNDLAVISPELETLSSGLTWGFQAGIGLDLFKKLSVDARYEGSLSKFGDKFTVGGVDYGLDARPKQWILALGWWF